MDDALFPFGYGLNYTQFEIGSAKVDKKIFAANEPIKLAVPISNKGKREGTEVLQVYVRKAGDENGPLKTLKGYNRVQLASGKTEQVNIALPPSSFEFYNVDQLKMMVTPGEYEVLYGNSSDSKDLKREKITIQ